MEKFTLEIEKLLESKLALYRQLNDVLKQEREFIVNIDVDSLWKSTAVKKELTESIQDIRKDIFAILEKEFGTGGLDVNTFSISYLIRIIQASEFQSQRLRKIKVAIDEQKDELKQSSDDNKKYVHEYLMVIDDIMSVVVDNSKEARYGQTGKVSDAKNSNCLIHAEV